MIIVEGPDGAGKTTLIEQLVREFDLDVAPRVVGKDTKDLVDLQSWVNANLAEGFQYKIFDRYRLISEFCYGPTLRPVQRPGFTDLLWVHHSLRRLYRDVRPIIIYCLPSLEVIKANLENDPDNEVVRDHIEQIYAAYLERASLDELLLPGHVMVWNYPLDDIIERKHSRHGTDSEVLQPFRPKIAYARERANHGRF